MGKEWLHWVGGGGGSSGRGGRSSSSASSATARSGRMASEAEETAAPTGCMCSVFQLFDLHHFQLPLNEQSSGFKPHDSFLDQEEATTVRKGVEAPRNSLESEEPAAMEAALRAKSLSVAMKQEEDLNFPVGMKIKTSSANVLKSRMDEFSSEYSSSSPGTKTPNLVARLMGLDLLPECTSPSFVSSSCKPARKSHLHKNRLKTDRSNRGCFDDELGAAGARSLPETPRISSARRSDEDIHRLSLQLNKENCTGEEFGVPPAKLRCRRGKFRGRDENRDNGSYVKQIVKRVEENLSRRVGLDDITNRNRPAEFIRRDENLVLLKPKQQIHASFSRFGDEAAIPTAKLRFLEATKNRSVADSNIKSPRTSTSSSDYNQSQGILMNSMKPKLPILQEIQQRKDQSKRVGSGKSSSSRPKKLHPQYSSDQAIKNKKEEQFVRSSAAVKARLTVKDSKKTSFPSDILSISAPTLLPVKKDPSPPVTKLPQKQSEVSYSLASKRRTRLSSNTSHSYKMHLDTDKILDVLENVGSDNSNGGATTDPSAAAAEYRNYIHRIVRRTRTKWHSSLHPLDPTIFHYLELFHPVTTTSAKVSVLSHRSNRKLIFQLVDELLADILNPSSNFQKRDTPISSIDVFPTLVDQLCQQIHAFPAAKCEFLEDIDALIEKDWRNLPLNRSLEEEGGSIRREIEGEILEALLRETVTIVGSRFRDVGGTETESGRCPVVAFTW